MFCSKCGARLNDNGVCPNCTVQSNVTPTSDECTIRIIRPKSFIGCVLTFGVLIDGQEVGKLKNGDTLEFKVTKGRHLVSFKAIEKTVSQEVEFTDPYRTVELTTCMKFGWITWVPGVGTINYR